MTCFAAVAACYALAAASDGAGVNAALMQRAIERAMQPQAARPAQLLRLERPRKCAVPLLRAPLDYSSAIPLKRAPLRSTNPKDGGVRLPQPSCGDETRTVRHVK